MKLTKEQYKKFTNWISMNYQELYENKVAHETRWDEDGNFYVRLLDESFVTLEDIMLDMAGRG
tara:strand:+ start:6388 stop:6576 length:189 start_codon:yes stop_codon:yes gene_type:complete